MGGVTDPPSSSRTEASSVAMSLGSDILLLHHQPDFSLDHVHDLFGDRHEQVKAIVQQSAENAAARLQGNNPVHMHIQVTRFHALTEKARYSTGGVHNVNFYVTLLDPVTGATLRPAEHVVTNLDALRGTEAIQADTRGDTQKHRITSFLTQVLQTELGTPKGYDDDNRGFFVALNRS